MKVKLDKVCKRIYAGGDVPKDRYSTVMTSEYTVPIYANAEKDDGLYGYTDTARENELSITVAARGTIGFTAIRREPFLPVVRLITVVPDVTKVSERYLYYALRSCKPTSSGTSIPQLTVPDIKKNEIELYSLPVQEKIADKLDVVVRIIALRQQELQRLDDLVKARFVEMFGNPVNNPFGLRTKPMTEICEIIDGDRGKNYPAANDFSDSGYCLFLNAKNVTLDGFNFENCMYITKEKDETLRKGRLNRGDVVLTTRGTIGNLALYTDEIPFEHIRINSGMVILRMKKVVDAVYFIEHFKMQLTDIKEKIASGSAQPQLPISTMNQVQILLPEIEQQRTFSDFVKKIDKSKAVIQEALNNAQLLFDSLMQQYLA
jgi:hypothetical protein